MTARSGPNFLINNMMLYLDAANLLSYPGSGSTWSDLSGNGRSLTISGSPTFASPGSLTFDGTQQLSALSLDNPNNAMTAQIVMNYTNTGAYHNLFDRTTSNPMFWIRPTGLIELNTSALVSPISYSGQIIVATATFSTSTPGIQLFINGTLVQITSAGQSAWPNPFTITMLNRAGSSRFVGTLYSIAFYNRVLTVDEIQQNFNAIRGRFGI